MPEPRRRTAKERLEQASSTIQDKLNKVQENAQPGLQDKVDNHFARSARSVSDQVENLRQCLKESNVDRILKDAEDFGRRYPWVMVAVGLGIGVAASRVLKASRS